MYYKGQKMRPKERKGAMTLTIGTGPFGDQGDKTFNFEMRPPGDHVLLFEDSPRRVRVMFGGRPWPTAGG